MKELKEFFHGVDKKRTGLALKKAKEAWAIHQRKTRRFLGHGWMQFDLREWRDKKADAVGSSDPDVLEPNSK